MLLIQGAGYPRWEGSHSGGAVGVDLHGVEQTCRMWWSRLSLRSWRRRGDCDGQAEVVRCNVL